MGLGPTQVMTLFTIIVVLATILVIIGFTKRKK